MRAQAREAVSQALIEHLEAMQAAERQSMRQPKQAEEARRSMTEQLENARAELGAVSSMAQIVAEIKGVEARCERKVRHWRELSR